MKTENIINNKKTNSGVTIIALTVVIIVLLILAGVSINSISGENGLIKRAGDAKDATNSSQEKELLQEAAVRSMEKSQTGDVVKSNLDEELNKNPGNGKYSSVLTENGIEVTFTDSNRKYIVNADGRVTPSI